MMARLTTLTWALAWLLGGGLGGLLGGLLATGRVQAQDRPPISVKLKDPWGTLAHEVVVTSVVVGGQECAVLQTTTGPAGFWCRPR